MRSIISGVKVVIAAVVHPVDEPTESFLPRKISPKGSGQDFLEAREWKLLYQSNRLESVRLVHHLPEDSNEVEPPPHPF